MKFSSFAADPNPHPAIVRCEDDLGANLRESPDVEFAKKDIARKQVIDRVPVC
jgi:hypothetical protein